MEDEFQCSGMCRASLFYFGRNITDSGMPMKSCLHDVKTYMMENGVPFAVCCILLTINSFLLAIIVSWVIAPGEDAAGVTGAAADSHGQH